MTGHPAGTDDPFAALRDEIAADPLNASFTARGWRPLVVGSPASRIVILSQAPGRRAQDSGIPFHDASGDRLLRWLGLTRERFDDVEKVAIVPMDFYYPGKGASGDLPPRRGIAAAWHPRVFELMRPSLRIVVGAYAQAFHLGDRRRETLTETVRNWRSYGPDVVPIVHPSPLNVGWHLRNPWFEEELVPDLRRRVADALNDR
ncbi:uracil-DNA glycosylase family protein [Agromyces sp. LHK192]|uniref:uracil-DNA glycosylase family protein n=1 Tax=Agromyces sp. LHK192 TaxID=2498704 RepID=UPI001F0BDA67|nr:uracil-DNA glycosylase family protein [Agromyces sp. LHK192]